MEVICPNCGEKYLRGVFDGGCPKCSVRNTKSWEAKEEK
jgi:predicted  nucleic acid-binding Zn-ribbon protein